LIEQLANAIKQKDYQTADQLLQQLQQEEPDNPWIQFYLARLEEATGDLKLAKQAYLSLLRGVVHPKIIAQSRQRIEHLTELEEKQYQQALEQAKHEPGSEELAVLILEPIAPEAKQQAAQKFAQIMHTDPYSARLQLPTRHWRLYRTGSLGELQFYTKALLEAKIPCFCTPIHPITDIHVYQVDYFQSLTPQITVCCHDEQNQPGFFSFDWSEVSQRVEGSLPLFEACVETNNRGQIERKTQTLDYLHFCDLHLPQRNSILRFWDQRYQFNRGVALFAPSQTDSSLEKTTTRNNWKQLIQYFQEQQPQIPLWSDFTGFAETALDFPELLKQIKPHIDLLRREETDWDAAFQLYSGLIFVKQ
jgi:hypothetical protein